MSGEFFFLSQQMDSVSHAHIAAHLQCVYAHYISEDQNLKFVLFTFAFIRSALEYRQDML